MNLQIWKEIEGYEKYSVSECGLVRNNKTGRVLAQSRDTHGYLGLQLYINNKAFRFRLHRLVAVAFIPKIEGKEYIDHINEDKTDNRSCNLRWCTHRENIGFYMFNHPEKQSKLEPYICETPNEKEKRFKNRSILVGEKLGTSIIVDGKQFDAVRQAARYVYELEPNKGKESTIRKEIQKVAKGKRNQFTMYGKFTIGF